MIRFELPQKYNVVFHFGHGHLFDAWSLLHLATGATIGLGTAWLGWNETWVLTIALAAMFLYELTEALIGIVENIENAILDVLIGGAGIMTVFQAIKLFGLGVSQIKISFFSLIVICLGLLYLGWRSYLRRRLNAPTEHLFPSWDEPISRRKIMVDLIIFGGAAVAFVPLPYLWLAYGFWALLWLIGVMLTITAGIRFVP